MKQIIKINQYALLTFGFFGFLFWHFAVQMLTIRADGWYVGQVNLYGDLVFHLGFINKFLETGKVLVSSPIYAGAKPNYPIFADWLTAQIARITGIDFALFLITFIVGIVTIYIAKKFILNFIKSEKIVFLSLLLFFFNGGFGFIYFFQDMANSQKPLFDFLISLPREYTDLKSLGYWWINSYLAYFLPQRAFLFAFPITLTILSLLYIGQKKSKTLFFILAGCLSGVLPIVQAHSLLLIFIVSAFYFPVSVYLSKNKNQTLKNWLFFAALTTIISLPILSSISSQNNLLGNIKFAPGWTSQENIIWFWFKNLGLFGPILIVSLIWLYLKKRILFLLYLPFLIVFILCNIFTFQPWNFDNSKLLIYWYFVSTISVAYFLYDKFLTEGIYQKIAGVAIIFILTFSALLDIFRTFTPSTFYKIFSNEDLQVAESVKKLTKKDAVFITAPIHNHPISALSGRSTVIGFYGWVWSHDLAYNQRAYDVGQIYEGSKHADQLVSQYQINYVTVGPPEREQLSINESYLSRFPTIHLGNGWQIYDVSSVWSDGNGQN